MAPKLLSPMHRVISLLPSATEIVSLLGAEHLLVGRGHEDDYPYSVKLLPVVTHSKSVFTSSAETDAFVFQSLQKGEALYHLHADLIKKLSPSVIITQTLCSVCAIDSGEVYRLSKQMLPPPLIVDLNPTCLNDIINDVIKIGKAIGFESEAEKVSNSLFSRVKAAQTQVKVKVKEIEVGQFANQKKPSVVFLEWTDPLFCGGHWTPELIEMAGALHPLNPTQHGGGAGESFRVTAQQVSEINPDWIIVCPCGLDLTLTKKELADVANQEWWQNLPAVQQGRVVVVDGNAMFNRSGPRLVDALEWLVGLLNDFPQIMPKDFPWEFWIQTKMESANHDHSIPSPLTLDQSPSLSNAICSNNVGGKEPSSSSPPPLLESKQHEDGCGEKSKEIGDGDENVNLDNFDDDDDDGDDPSLLGGEWHSSKLSFEIEEAHKNAQQRNESLYIDPVTGFNVLTENFLSRRENCCGNRCRHCPYGHFAVDSDIQNQINTFHESRFLTSQVKNKSFKNKKFNLIFWNGDINSFVLLKKLKHAMIYSHSSATNSNSNSNSNVLDLQSPSQESNVAMSPTNLNVDSDFDFDFDHEIALMAFFESHSGRVLSFSEKENKNENENKIENESDTQKNIFLLPVSIRAVMKQAKKLNFPLLAIAVKKKKSMKSMKNTDAWDSLRSDFLNAIELIPGNVENVISGSRLQSLWDSKNEIFLKKNVRLFHISQKDSKNSKPNFHHLFPGFKEEKIKFHFGYHALKSKPAAKFAFDDDFIQSYSTFLSKYDWNFVEVN